MRASFGWRALMPTTLNEREQAFEAKFARDEEFPPRSPHLNGKVERVQRTVLEEFWPTAEPKVPGLAERLAEWVHYYNWHRRHEALNGSTPINRVCEARQQNTSTR
jgi:transposase InsO family protein